MMSYLDFWNPNSVQSNPTNEIPKIKTIIKKVKGSRCTLLRFLDVWGMRVIPK